VWNVFDLWSLLLLYSPCSLLWETPTVREHLMFYGRLKRLNGAALIEVLPVYRVPSTISFWYCFHESNILPFPRVRYTLFPSWSTMQIVYMHYKLYLNMYAIFIFLRTCYARVSLRGEDVTHRSTIQNRYDTDQHAKCLGRHKTKRKRKRKRKKEKQTQTTQGLKLHLKLPLLKPLYNRQTD